jgi:thioredoxin
MAVIRTCKVCGTANRVPGKFLASAGKCGKCKAPLPAVNEPIGVDETQFDEITKNATVPVLVDFWADWCGPCKAIAPALEEIGAEYAGKLTIAKVNIDDNPVTPNTYAVRGIPTLILFKDGKPVSTKVGAAPKSVLKQWVEASL